MLLFFNYIINLGLLQQEVFKYQVKIWAIISNMRKYKKLPM